MIKEIKNFLLSSEGKFNIEFFSGITVSLALIPEAIAFALVAHVDPLIGLYAAFFMCLITSIIGGRPGMISGATGSMAVVMVGLVSQYGIDYLFPTIVLTGIIQIIVGGFKLGKLTNFLPKSVMVGFVNGLAIIIFLAQLEHFKINTNKLNIWLYGMPLVIMIILILISMIITYYLPKFIKKVPSALISIIIITCIVQISNIDTRIVNDMVLGQNMSIILPNFNWISIPFSLETLNIIFPYALTLAIIGLSESLMTLSLIDEITNTKSHANKECIAQGIGNIICGFFNSMGGCAMLGQSIINIKSGGRGRLSGIIASIFLLLLILGLWPIIKIIPVAAIIGVMFIVVIETFEWKTFKIIQKIPTHDTLLIIIVTIITILTNLAISVITGIIISALIFVWKNSKNIYVKKRINTKGIKEYKLYGSLFFASISQFKLFFDVVKDPNKIIIDFLYSRIHDYSAIYAIQFITEKYVKCNKIVYLQNLSSECMILVKKSDKLKSKILKDFDSSNLLIIK